MINVCSFTEVGGHAQNEDSFIVERHPLNSEMYLFALADGQGGQRGGGRASQLACSEIMAVARTVAPKKLISTAMWKSILERVDNTVDNDPDAGFTTLIGFCVIENTLFGASSGDSAILHVSGNGKTFELTANQRKNPPVGSSAADVIAFSNQLTEPWQVLAMSDGVWKYVGWDRIKELVKDHRGQELIDALQSLARLPGNKKFQDDFTVIAVNNP